MVPTTYQQIKFSIENSFFQVDFVCWASSTKTSVVSYLQSDFLQKSPFHITGRFAHKKQQKANRIFIAAIWLKAPKESICSNLFQAHYVQSLTLFRRVL